ncbi:hypothetical protein [Thermus sp. LT1-2-5]
MRKAAYALLLGLALLLAACGGAGGYRLGRRGWRRRGWRRQ